MRYLFVLLLGACAAPQPEPRYEWYRQTGLADLQADLGQCEAQAFAVPGATRNLMQVAMVRESCMRGKGYTIRQVQ